MIGALLVSVGLAAEPEPTAAPDPASVVQPHQPVILEPLPQHVPKDQQPPPGTLKLGFIALPTFNYNTTDGFGLGAGAELYLRKPDDDDGYRYRFSLSTFWTTSGNYSSSFVQVESRGDHYWMARVAYRFWRNMTYVGAGGADVARLRAPDEALGNYVGGPQFVANVVRMVRGTPIRVYVQGYVRHATVRPNPGGLLDQRDPLGASGGTYFDATAGIWIQEVDRWPLPMQGVNFELSGRFGGTVADGGRFYPLPGIFTELTAWYPVAGPWLTVGSRTVLDKTFGQRPFFEQEWLGGIQRDEAAYEQMFTGYGRSRTRGDGMLASALELRAFFVRSRHPTWDVSLYLSVYAEAGWIFDRNRLGPLMPTVGIAPILMWQGAVPLRPFIAWGWTRDTADGPRRPSSQVGISLLGVL